MIREELLHAAFIHFPIAIFALALVAKLFEIILLMLGKKHAYELGVIVKGLLFVGPLFYLVSIYLGDMSFELIKADICNLTLVYEHEEMAEIPIPFFLLAIVFEVLILSKAKQILRWVKAIHVFTLISLIIGNYFMFQAAHMGGELVYEYGTAVKNVRCEK